MPNATNKQLVTEIREKLSTAKSVIFADYKGLKSNQINDLRAQMREAGTEVLVAKNTLLKIALKQENYDVEKAEKLLKENTATFINYKDPILSIKKLYEFVKKAELPKVKAAFVDKLFTSAADIETMSTLPSKEQLLASLVYTLKSPITGFVNVLGGPQRKLVYALSAIAKKKES